MKGIAHAHVIEFVRFPHACSIHVYDDFQRRLHHILRDTPCNTRSDDTEQKAFDQCELIILDSLGRQVIRDAREDQDGQNAFSPSSQKPVQALLQGLTRGLGHHASSPTRRSSNKP